MQLLDNNEKETFMGSFPQVNPRYGKVLASRSYKGRYVASLITLWVLDVI